MILFILSFTPLILVSNVCNAVETQCPHQLHATRKIDSLGFHRNVYYNISLKSTSQIDKCKLCIQESLPPGLFVNKDQLQDFLRLGKLSASVDGIVDIESPASISAPIIVRILSELTSTSEHLFHGSAVLPIHTRYHSPQPGGGFKKVTIGKPELYIHCDGETSPHVKGEVFLTPCAGINNTPLPFYKVAYSIDEEDAQLNLEVPVGDSDSLLLVQTATIFVTMIGSLYITGVILKI